VDNWTRIISNCRYVLNNATTWISNCQNYVTNPLPPLRGSSIPKVSDLQNFKGFGIDGAGAISFLLTLEDLLDLHHVQSAHRVILTSKAVPYRARTIIYSLAL
jgi:hypothetical protein